MSLSLQPESAAPAGTVPTDAEQAKWQKMSAYKQIASLPNAKEALDMMVASYHRPSAQPGRLLSDAMLAGWPAKELREIANRIGATPRDGKNCAEPMRDEIRRMLQQHADANPILLEEQQDATRVLASKHGGPADDDEDLASAAEEGPADDDFEERKEARRPKLDRESKKKKPSGPSAAALGALRGVPSSPSARKVSRPATPKKASRSGKSAKAKPSSARRLFDRESSESEEEPSSPSGSDPSDPDFDGDDPSPPESDEEDVDVGRARFPIMPTSSGSRIHRSSRLSAHVVKEMRAHGIDAPWGREFIANALRSQGGLGSLAQVYKHEVEFTSKRNKMEMLAWCRVIDALRNGQDEVALELAVRRLAGVHTADISGTWEACAEFELDTTRQSFVPAAPLKAALKSVGRSQTLKKLGEKPTAVTSAVVKKATWINREQTTATQVAPQTGSGASPSSARRSSRPPQRR